jgi:hypothetical protein
MIDCKHIPTKMKAARRWLLWRQEVRRGSDTPSKLPYYANSKERGKGGKLDDENDLAQLATLDEVLAVLKNPPVKPFDGIGFALGPDGTGNCWQGIDLDHVREKGLTELVKELPSYVESSPSGDGVHAMGYGKGFPALGSNVTGIEAYSEKRYFTVTGKVLIGDSLCDLSGFITQRLAPLHKTGPRPASVDTGDIETQGTQGTQGTQERRLGGNRAAINLADFSLADLPDNCLPTGRGQRHRNLFHLARHLKTRYPDAEAKDAMPVVRAWHAEFLPLIATKSWAETWANFTRAWPDIRYLEGEGTLDGIFASLDQTEPPPASLAEMGYDAEMWAIVRFLAKLSRNSEDGVFFLSLRTVAMLIGMSVQGAGNLMKLMMDDGLIELINKGALKSRKASTYRFIWQHGTVGS